MRVHLLSPYSATALLPIVEAVEREGDEITDGEPDITVMWGHRHILKPKEISGRRIINIHISYLPWNRGASPNLWSWHDDTPKGVTIHEVDEGIDTGPILVRRSVMLDEDSETLRTSYEKLQAAATNVFCKFWPMGISKWRGLRDLGDGSYHTVVESADLMRHFPDGLDTPVKRIVEFGRASRAACM